MTFVSRRVAGFLVGLAALVAQAPALAAGYVLHMLPSLGGTPSRAVSINAQGVIVGSSATPDGFVHAAVWRDGHVHTLVPDGSKAWSINDRGMVVLVSGSSSYLLRPGHEALRLSDLWYPAMINQQGVMAGRWGSGDDGAIMTARKAFGLVGPPNNFGTSASWLNERREAVGFSRVNGNDAPTLWRDDGQYVLLPVLGTGGVATAVNDHGMIVGRCWDDDGFVHTQAVRWDHLQPVALPGPLPSAANAANDVGQIVGSITPVPGSPTHAALWTQSGMTDLNDYLDPAMKQAGWVVQAAYAINASGWIVGEMDNTVTLEKRAYVLTR